ncbi:hypothetical protein BGX30_004742 [Mortierella sp. GBA39]|nr:hypothetical protein BGX30_004742 [Mortierella sp. GBA39]
MLQQCTRLQRLRIEGRAKDGLELESWSKILGSGLPGTITNLTLAIESQVSFAFSPLPPILFSRCSCNLQELSLHMTHSYPRVQSEQPTGENWDNGVEEPLPSLRILNVTCQSSRMYSSPLLKFISRCTHLESLHISSLNETWTGVLGACLHLKSLRIVIFDTKSAQLLTDELINGLPSLANIHIDCYFEDMRDQDLAKMFSACRTGWRSINAPCIDKFAVEVIVQHYPTLEELSLKRAYELSSKYMQQILSSGPRLRSFITLIDEDDSFPYIDASQILALDFIDADSSSDSLRPWACESTLTVLRAKILGIPRPDITKTYSGRPLEDGMLGHEDRDVYDASRKIGGLDDIGRQYKCLEKSLKSGLQMLEGLKQLRVLSVVRMATSIGVKEIIPLIGSYLLPVDLLQCVRVNQEWNIALIPLLWRTIDSSLPTWHKILKEYDSEIAQEQLDEQWPQLLFNKYSHHIRALKVYHRDIFRFVRRGGTCTRLQTLEVFYLDGNETLYQEYNIDHGLGFSPLEECEKGAYSDTVLSRLFEGVFRPEESCGRSLTSQKRDWFALQHSWLLVLANPGLTFLHMSRNLRRLSNLANESGPFYYKALSRLKNLVTFSDPYYRLSLPALLESLPLLPKWNRLLDVTYPHLETLELKKGLVYIGDVFNTMKHCPNVVYLGFEGVSLEPIKYFEDM